MADSEEIANIAMAALQEQDFVAARQAAENALAIHDEVRVSSWATAHRCIAIVCWREENWKSCRHHFAEEVRLLAGLKPPNLVRLISARDDLALLDYKLGQFGSALAMREETLRMAKEDLSVPGVLSRRLERRLAQSLQRQGFMDSAEQALARAHPNEGDGYSDWLGWHVAVALLAEQRGDLATAAERYRKLLEFLDAHGSDEEGHSDALANALMAYLELGDERHAATLFRKLRHSLKKNYHASARLRLLDLRMLLLNGRGRFAAASVIAERAERLMVDLVGVEHEDLVNRAAVRAAMLRGAGRSSQAKKLLLARLPSEPTPAATAALVELAEILAEESNYDDALVTLECALAGELGQDFAEARWRSLLALSDTLYRRGKPKAGLLVGKMALEPIRQAAAGLSGENRGRWLQSRIAAYDRLLDRLSLAGRLPEAAALQIRRFQETSREIGYRRPQLEGTVSPVPYRPAEALLRGHYEVLQKSTAPRSDARKAVANWLKDVQTLDIADADYDPPTGVRGRSLRLMAGHDYARALLSDDEGNLCSYPIKLTPEELAGGVRALREAIGNRSDDWLDISCKLHDAIFGAILSDVAHWQRLDIVASGLFSFVPFPSLHNGHSFLIERFDLAMRTGQLTGPSSAGSPKDWKLAAFGASVSGGGDEPLPGVRLEIDSLSAFSNARRLLDQDFTASSLRHELARAPQILHVGSHFSFHPAQPHLSALKLGDDSLLPIANLSGPEYDFSSLELLVLAACETGISDTLDIGVEGIAGLAQAKGAKTVVASLWEVPDSGTSQMMSRFYAELLKQQRADIPAALANAQRAMIHGPPSASSTSAVRGRGIGGGSRPSSAWHPLDWSGFVAFVSEAAVV